METLRVGSKGEGVYKWENFLRGQNLLLVKEVDTSYTSVTALATTAFQRKYGLTADGIAGPKTQTFATQRFGYAAVTDRDLPVKPPNVSSLTPAQRVQLFGVIEYIADGTPSNPERIKIINDWQKVHLGSVEIPQLKNVKGAGRTVSFHKKAIPQLVRFFERVEKEDLLSHLLTWGGTWSPRFIRGSRTTLSNHSWATAFDCNVAWNGLGVRPALMGTEGSVRELVEIGYEHGLIWGGHWPSRPDGMHFEVYKLV